MSQPEPGQPMRWSAIAAGSPVHLVSCRPEPAVAALTHPGRR